METSNTTDTTRRKPTENEALFWREAFVCAFLQISRSTLRRLIAAREFPTPVKLSASCIAFPVAEVREWAAKRMASRDTPGQAA